MKKLLLASAAARAMTHRAMITPPMADAGLADVVKAQKEIAVLFNEFKQDNDKRLADIEKKGSADPLTTEKVEKMSLALGDLSGRVDKFIADQEKLSQERQLREGRMGLAGNETEGLSVQAQATRFYAMCARRAGKEFKADSVDVDRYLAYKAALDQYIRQPIDSLNSEIRNDLSVGSDKDGGFIVTPERSTEVQKRLFDTSPIRQYARQVTISKDKITLPLQVGKIANGGYGAEKTAPSKTDTGDFSEQTIEVHRLWAQPEVTQDFLDDADINVEAWLQEEAILSFSLTENEKFVNGSGVKQPRGFMSYQDSAVVTNDAARAWGKVQYVKTGTSGAFANDGTGGDCLINVIHAMKAPLRNNARWAANRFTLAKVRQLKDGDGNYLWSMGDVQKGQPSSLLGYATAEFEDMDDIAANSFSMAFADFQKAYLIVDRKGLTLLRDPYTNKPFVKFYYYMRNGGDIRDFDAIKYVKFAS